MLILTIAGGILLAVIGALLLLAYGRAILRGVAVLPGLAIVLLALYEAPVIGGCIVATLAGLGVVLVLRARYGRDSVAADSGTNPPHKLIGRDPHNGRFTASLPEQIPGGNRP